MVGRQLCYGDTFTDYLENILTEDTSDDSINNELVLTPTERQFLALNVSGEEFTKLFSAVMTGADLAYTTEAHQLVWLLWKAVKMDSFCAAVTDAIQNCTDVQAAILVLNLAQGTNTTGDPDNIIPLSASAKNLLPAGYTCDPDHRYGMALAVVDALHTATQEVFQAIEVLTNPLELVNELADNIPIGGLVSTAGDIISWIQNTAQEAYELAWSDTVRDSIACDLFCAMLVDEECELTYDMIVGIYKDIPGVTIPEFSDWFSWVEFIITIPLTASEQVVKACSLLGLGAIMFGSRFGKFQLGLRSLETTVALAADDESSDWEIVCDACPEEWYHADDLTEGEQGWTVTKGSYSAGNGFIVGDYQPSIWIRQVDIHKSFDLSNVTKIKMTWDVVWGDYTGTSFAYLIRTEPNDEYEQVLQELRGENGERTFEFEPVMDIDDIRLAVRCSIMPTQPELGGTATLTLVEMWGFGDNPFD